MDQKLFEQLVMITGRLCILSKILQRSDDAFEAEYGELGL